MIDVAHNDRAEIIRKKQEIVDCKDLISSIALKSGAELNDWFNAHFSSLPENVKSGLLDLVRVVWALSKTQLKIWNNLEFSK